MSNKIVQVIDIATNYKDSRYSYNAEIIPKVSIRIHGTVPTTQELPPLVFNRTFKIGDTVEYHSYNLVYTGTITSIGPKTVTVKDGRRMRRLNLSTFIWRNWDFDLGKIAKRNFETMQHI